VAQKILIVDDSPTIRTLVKLFLMGRKFEFFEAGDGEAALALAKRNPIQLVIADFNMPKMDGLSFVHQLRTAVDPYLRGLPVILLTANREADLAVRAIAEGVNAFARKPISQDQLFATVNQLLPSGAS
jgi:two-component system, chemotaxis family, chemotaxis protein CheY